MRGTVKVKRSKVKVSRSGDVVAQKHRIRCCHFQGTRRKPFPLLKCLITHYGRLFEPFSGRKCTRLQDFAYTISFFLSWLILPGHRRSARWCMDPDNCFCLDRQRSNCFDYTRRPQTEIPMQNICFRFYSRSERKKYQTVGPVSTAAEFVPSTRHR